MATNLPTSGPNPIIAPASPPTAIPLSWDGDRMFNIYIHDYCTKRGFKETAHRLMHEAEIPPDSTPPINAKQGLLFEWWSVFWVLFTAKSSGAGTDDAMIYTQHQAQQNAQRQAQARQQGTQQAQTNRFTNGRTPATGAPAPVPITNGVGHNGAPAAPGGLSNGTAGSVPFSGGMSQANGVPGPSHAPHGGVATGQPQVMGLMPGQRAVGPPPRGPNGASAFQSPTMAHSPQNPGGVGQQPNMGQMNSSQSLAQMNRGMLPPNGMQGPFSGPSQQTAQTSFQALGRSPSAPGSPGQPNMITGRSPSMAARQPPGTATDPRMSQEQAANQELVRFPPHVLNQLKQEAGLGDKDLPSLSAEEKQRILAIARQRGFGKPNFGPPRPNNATAGPSGSTPAMQPPAQQRNPQMPVGTQPQQPPQPGQQQPQQQRANKRSTSPGQDHESRNDSSPPDRKRMRRSPAGQDQSQPPPMTPMMPYPGQPGGPTGAQQMPNGMMQRTMGGFPGQPGMPGMGGPQGMNMQMGPQQMSTMSPGMMNHQGPGAMMNQQMPQQQLSAREVQYRQSMRDLHKNGMPHTALGGLMPGPAGASPSSDGQFNPDGQPRPGTGQFPGAPGGPGANRMAQPKPPMAMMPPPPSPGLNAQKKDGPGGEGSAQNGASPQNAAAGIGGQNQQPGSGAAPLTPSASSGNMTAPSPSAILNSSSAPTMGSGHSVDSMASGLFTSDFMSSGLDDFDTSMFRPSEDIGGMVNFEDWFSTDSGGLDLGK